MGKKKWEYTWINLPLDQGLWEQVLDAAGKESWELVNVTIAPNKVYTAFFKRPK